MNNFEEKWGEEFETLVDEVMEERAAGEPNALISEDQMKERVREEVREILKFEKETKAVTHSIELLVQLGPSIFGQDRMNVIFDEIRHAGEVLIESSEEIANSPEKTIEMIGVTEETINDILKLAYRQYEQENWENAESLYLFLTILVPTNADLWMCLGSALQNQSKLLEARECYTQATNLDGKDPHYPLYIAECFLFEGDLKSCEEWEEVGRIIAEEGERDDEVIEMFDAVKEALVAAA